MKRIYLILVLICSCFVCNAQSEDNSCRNRLKKAQNEYKNGDKEKAKKSIQAIIDYCDDATSADAKKWLEDREREEQKLILAEQKAEQERIKREKEEEEARKKIAEQKKKETYSKVTGYTPSYTKKKSSFWDDVAYYFEDPFDNLRFIRQLYYSYSDIYPIIFSYNRAFSPYISIGGEVGFDYKTKGKEIADYDPTIYFLGNLGFNMKFLSFYIGFGPAYFWGPGTWAPYEISTSTTVNGEVTHSYNNKEDERYQLGHSLFLMKPSVSLNIGFLHLNCGYFIFPSKSKLNCFSLGLGFSL